VGFCACAYYEPRRRNSIRRAFAENDRPPRRRGEDLDRVTEPVTGDGVAGHGLPGVIMQPLEQEPVPGGVSLAKRRLVAPVRRRLRDVREPRDVFDDRSQRRRGAVDAGGKSGRGELFLDRCRVEAAASLQPELCCGLRVAFRATPFRPLRDRSFTDGSVSM
jgi:hypothetical protein